MIQKEYTWLARGASHQFGESRHIDLEKYHSFVLAGIGLDEDIDFKKGVIGDDLLLESIREEYLGSNATGDIPLEISLPQLLEAVADWYKIDGETFPVLGNDRKASRGP